MDPFLKWPGGKRWLLNVRPELFQQSFNRYVEPFAGGGAVFFSLEPRRSVLGDINRELISMYLAVRDGWNAISRLLEQHQARHCERYYYSMRASSPASRFERAARFIYLNRTCWNGLYRVNLRGEFNVPIGTKTSVVLPNDDFKRAANILSNAKVLCRDFSATIADAKNGDLVFVDPPYVAQENPATFRKYHSRSFTWEDQIRLCEALVEARKRKARIIVLNADTPSIRSMYQKHFDLASIGTRNTLAADSSRRGRRDELLATA